MISATEFLNAAFPRDLLVPDEHVLISWPTHFFDGGVRKDYYAQVGYHPRARLPLPADKPWLYCVSTVSPTGRAQLKRTANAVQSAYVLPCDDIGTKCRPAPVDPSYVLETSKGNFQHAYFIDPFDVSTPVGAAYYDACRLGLARAGYNDFGCRSATRVVRLPGATHATGFEAVIREWNPDAVWDLKELMQALDVEPALDVVRPKGKRRASKLTELEDVSDPVYRWLLKQGLVTDVRDQWVHIECPWAHTHSDGTGEEAGYSPLNFMTMGRGFNCFHSHGEEHGLKEFLAWVIEQGGPSTDPSFERIRNLLQCSQ